MFCCTDNVIFPGASWSKVTGLLFTLEVNLKWTSTQVKELEWNNNNKKSVVKGVLQKMNWQECSWFKINTQEAEEAVG